jgi:hypothetical protein
LAIHTFGFSFSFLASKLVLCDCKYFKDGCILQLAILLLRDSVQVNGQAGLTDKLLNIVQLCVSNLDWDSSYFD